MTPSLKVVSLALCCRPTFWKPDPAACQMTPGLHIYTGNRLEDLASALAQVLASPDNQSGPRKPLEPEWIVVQSKGMQRWLSMLLADLLGACVNIRFPFPNQLLDHLYLASGLEDEIIPGENNLDLWDPDVLSFRILALLETDIHQPELKPLQRYLEPEPTSLKKYQLAAAIAAALDQYQVFRPNLLRKWENGKQGSRKHEQWQASIWQRLVKQCPVAHRGRRQQLLLQWIHASPDSGSKLPSRLMVFGISHLPPFHLEILQALGSKIPVYFFLFNPCRAYWADILSPVAQQRLQQRLPASTTQKEDLHFFSGNRLLAFWGAMGRAFFEQISALESFQYELFTEGPGDSALAIVQNDILDLSEGSGPDKGNTSFPADDASIQVHVCHSPMRELEVLYDNLANWLATDPELSCNDILVMTPELDKYAPLIHAVFGHQETGRPKLPFTVADKDDLGTDPAVRAFFKILDLPNGRMETSQVLELLECESICARFGIDPETRAQLPAWITEAGIRWGADAGDLARHGFLPEESNTWVAGLDRLVLGSAMQPEDRLAAGILPCHQVEGARALALGRFIALFDALSQIRNVLAGSWNGSRWSVILQEVIDRFFAEHGPFPTGLAGLRKIITHWHKCLEKSGYESELPLELVAHLLSAKIEESGAGSGFLSGGITFCAMLPMRSIPAKVICLIGMGQGCFPRPARHPGFDMLQSEPKPWDRNRRLDDMYLFLESLLSARKVFYISYVGRSVHDDTNIAPSTMVSQLLEYLAARFDQPPDHWVTVHRLHGFAPEYFSGESPRLFSFSQQDYLACRADRKPKKQLPPLLHDHTLEPPSERWKNLTLKEMEDFFVHPCRFLLQNRLGIRFPRPQKPLEDKENFSLTGLDRYRVYQKILEGRLKAIAHQELECLIKAQGLLPHGCLAPTTYKTMAGETDVFLEKLAEITESGEGEDDSFGLQFSGFKISGRLENIFPQGQVIYRFANLRARDFMAAFIRHLLFQLVEWDSDRQRQTWLIGRNELWRLRPPDDPNAIMATYLDLYWQGLIRPLPLVLEASMEYAKRVLVGGQARSAALDAALKKMRPYNISRLEAADPYLECCFGPDHEFGTRFQDTATAVFKPLLKCLESKNQHF